MPANKTTGPAILALKGPSKSVQVLLNGIGACRVLTLIIASP